jgi:hypothetical protein
MHSLAVFGRGQGTWSECTLQRASRDPAWVIAATDVRGVAEGRTAPSDRDRPARLHGEWPWGLGVRRYRRGLHGLADVRVDCGRGRRIHLDRTSLATRGRPATGGLRNRGLDDAQWLALPVGHDVTTLRSPGLGGCSLAASSTQSRPAVARFVPASTSSASSSALRASSSKASSG